MRTELNQYSGHLFQMLQELGQKQGYSPLEYAEAIFNTALGFHPDQVTIAGLSNDDAEEALIKVRAMVHLAFAINDFGYEGG